MNTLVVIFAFVTCAFATSPPKCEKPLCPADCGISNGPDGCPKCDCLDPVTLPPQIKCSPPKCSDGCELKTRPGGICPTCSCPRAKNVTCHHIKCPGECSVGVDTNGCGLCACPEGTTTEKGLDKQLGEACLSTADCTAAYSSCKNNKCTCIDGFKTDGTVCKAPAFQCPTWKGQKSATAGSPCKHRYNPPSSNGTVTETSSCDNSKEFCFIHPKEKSENGTNVGHCCPNPPKDAEVTLVCPYAGPTDNGTCPDLSGFPADAPIPESKQRTCSYSASECVHRFKQSTCCPLPCTGSSSHFSVEGKCFDYVQIGQVCENNAVCIGGSRCVHAGSGKPLCRCPAKTCTEPSEHCCDA